MSKSENLIKDLLSKYSSNTISDQELNVLQVLLKAGIDADEFKKTLDEDWKTLVDSKIEIDDLSEKLFEKILEKAKERERLRLSKAKRWISLSRIAAVFIGLIVLGYTYLQITNQKTTVITNNAITLELEDGSIEIVEEGGTMSVLDKYGNVVGNQQGNKLTYNTIDIDTSKELAYNTLVVPNGKRFELVLSDGTIAHLNAGSSLRYPIQFLQGSQREVSVSGEVYFDVTRDSVHPFVVHVDKLNIRVLGTQFNVHSYPEDDVTEVVLVEGAVGLYSEKEYKSESSILLEPGFKARYSKINQDINIRKVATNVYISWRAGELVFRNMSFKNITKKLERHFNVTIQNNNIELSETIFNASFGDEPLNVVLKSLKDNYQINYVIEESNKIIID